MRLGLLFERFLSPERDGPPDIDLDIESDRREEVIQYVYERYGRDHAAQVANVITYRPKSAVRDMGKALGLRHRPAGRLVASRSTAGGRSVGHASTTTSPSAVLELASEVQHFPRHLGIHSGGMVICDRPVVEVCPVEWGRMEDRTVLQWDKDDCAAAGLVKFDLLGLGMLTALHYAVDLVREHHGVEVDLATIPQEDAVYDMLCRADSVGVFQVESRAQMATLPRLKPRTFYDLVVEVALIRPGPIQGGSVHPYIRRRNGQEPVTYLHPLLEQSLDKTLGVPLFQEQLMQMAIDVAGFTAGRGRPAAPGHGLEALPASGWSGCAAGSTRAWPSGGITGEVADEIYDKLAAFANFGFPESHSVSFAYLVYSQRVAQAALPGRVLRGAAQRPADGLLLAADPGAPTPAATASRSAAPTSTPARAGHARAPRARPPGQRRGRRLAVRLGSSTCARSATTWPSGIAGGPAVRVDMEDLVRRNGADRPPQVEALATAGAFGCFGLEPARGAVGGGGGGPGRARPAGGRRHRRATRPTLPGMADVGGDRRPTCGPPGSRPTVTRRSSRAPGSTRSARCASTALADGRARHPGARRRRRHPPPAPGHRPGHHLPQPRGRDRPDQRHLLAGRVGPPPPGGPRSARAAHPGPAGEGRGRDQRGRRAHRAAHPVDRGPESRDFR